MRFTTTTVSASLLALTRLALHREAARPATPVSGNGQRAVRHRSPVARLLPAIREARSLASSLALALVQSAAERGRAFGAGLAADGRR